MPTITFRNGVASCLVHRGPHLLALLAVRGGVFELDAWIGEETVSLRVPANRHYDAFMAINKWEHSGVPFRKVVRGDESDGDWLINEVDLFLRATTCNL